MSDAEIWIDRGRQSGEPCVYGHRLPTRLIASLHRDGPEVPRDWYPYLTDEQISAAVWFEATFQRRTPADILRGDDIQPFDISGDHETRGDNPGRQA